MRSLIGKLTTSVDSASTQLQHLEKEVRSKEKVIGVLYNRVEQLNSLLRDQSAAILNAQMRTMEQQQQRELQQQQQQQSQLPRSPNVR